MANLFKKLEVGDQVNFVTRHDEEYIWGSGTISALHPRDMLVELTDASVVVDVRCLYEQ